MSLPNTDAITSQRGRVGKFSSMNLARDLLDQCDEQRADDTTP